MAQRFLAGAATSNISPPLGVSINGGMSDRTATHIHDELHARCLVLDDGDSRIALVVCDSCAIPGELMDAAKQLVHGTDSTLLPERILVSATHTHTAPTVVGVFQSDPNLEYQEFLVGRIADGIRRAVNNLGPARIGWGVGREPSQVFNRRWRMKPGTIPADPFGNQTDTVQMNPPRGSENLLEPSGPTDPEVSLLSVTTPDGTPISVLANYSLHYVGGTGPGHISADYFGMFADRLQQLLGADRLDPAFVGILSNGTSGNINNVDFKNPGQRQPPYAQMGRVAHLVAEEAHRVLKGLKYHDWVPLRMAESRLRLGRRLPRKDEVERAQFILSQARGAVLKTREEIYARETMLMKDLPPVHETVVQAIGIGELGIVSSPCETFVETGLAIKEQSPLKPAFTIELANDYAGYLPTVEHHRYGGYETWRARSSFLEAGAEPKIRGELLKLLGQVAKG
jgi:hypothetical protein